jgi:carboxymethylenebutenolidase
MRNLAAILLLLTACATTTPDPVADRLEHSPRHNEWIQIQRDSRTIHAYVAYPQVSAKAPAVIVIHENRGLTDWERSVADKLAESGFIAIAPDLLSGMGPSGGRASDFPSQDAAREAIGKLPPDQVLADLNRVGDYVKSLPAASGELSVGGFCWGGGKTWALANSRRDLSGAYVFYGTGPQDESGVTNIIAPVFGFYGGSDARVNATIPKTEELMRAAGKRFEPVIYDGAGHAFMRLGMQPDANEANRKAHDQAWVRWISLLRSH